MGLPPRKDLLAAADRLQARGHSLTPGEQGAAAALAWLVGASGTSLGAFLDRPLGRCSPRKTANVRSVGEAAYIAMHRAETDEARQFARGVTSVLIVAATNGELPALVGDAG